MINYYPLVRQPRPRRINNRNSRASESKASSSLECSAERSRESTKVNFLVPARAKHQARLNALPSAAENQRS